MLSSVNHRPSPAGFEPKSCVYTMGKHPLSHSWTLWYYRNDRSRSWELNQSPILSFQTVEDFWSLYNHLELASKLPIGSDYSVFKSGIAPMWEDPANRAGGRWVIHLNRKRHSGHLDASWLEILLCLIGETFGDDGLHVNGAVISIRAKGDKIGVWLSDTNAADSVVRTGERIKEKLGMKNLTLSFEAHEDTMVKTTTMAPAKTTYVV